jgi:DNA-binding NtrC family response regulator
MMNSPFHILIADSDENILSTTTGLLQEAGYQCFPVRDGFEAFRALEADEYDLLITEIGIPGNEDLELVWSAYRYAQGMPVIICTGHPSLHSAITSIQLAVAAYLIKPVEFNVLLRYVKEGIASYHDFKLHGSEDTREQIDQLTNAIEETIRVLQDTRSAFKSQQLAALRVKLQQLLASGQSR